MTHDFTTDANWYLEASTDDLYAQLGAILLGDGLGAASKDPGSRRRFGREWFQASAKKLQDLVCGSKLTTDVIQNTPGDLAAITTAVIPLVDEQLLAVTVAAIILRTGIATFCSGWSDL